MASTVIELDGMVDDLTLGAIALGSQGIVSPASLPAGVAVKQEVADDAEDGRASIDQLMQETEAECGTQRSLKEGSGGSTKSQKTALDTTAQLVCSTCQSTSSDPDLSDPSCTRTTPFARARLRADQYVACDHCDSLIRSSLTASTAASVLASFDEPGERRKFLRLLACSLSMKATTESATKVHRVTLLKTESLVTSFESIAKALEARAAGFKLVGKDSSPHNVLGLKDYVKAFGNPMANGEVMAQALVNDCVQVVVLTKKPVTPGRHSMAQVVSQAASGFASETLDRAKTMSADSLETCKLMGHLVTEYASRTRWQLEVNTLLGTPVATPTIAIAAMPPASAAEEQPASTPTKSVSGGFAGGCGSIADEDSGLFGDLFDDAGEDDDGIGSETASRFSGAPSSVASPAMVGGMAPSSTTASPPAKTPTKKQQRRPASPAPARKGSISASVGSAQLASVEMSPGSAPPNKDTERLQRRAWEFCRLFVGNTWRKGLRGKEKAITNLIVRVEDMVVRCKAARREDRVPVLDIVHKVLEACKSLVQKGKDRTNEQWAQKVIHTEIALIDGFLREHSEKFSDDGLLTVDASLRKLEVPSKPPRLYNAP